MIPLLRPLAWLTSVSLILLGVSAAGALVE